MFEWHDLNARHEATFLWFAAMLVFAAANSPDLRRSAYNLLKMLLSPAISPLIAGLLANVTFLTFMAVLVGRKVGLWEPLPLVTATVWTFTTGFSLLLNLDESLKANNAFKKRVVTLLGPSTVVAEIVGVTILAFWWELLLAPILFVLAYGVYANRSTGLRITSGVLLLAYAAGLMLGVIIDLAGDVNTWRSPTQAILLPIMLTIGTLPYVQLLVLVERFRFRRGANSKTVKSSEYGKDWPLTIDSATLCCRFGAVWLEASGKRYAVNGTAKPILKKYGYASLELNDIWRDHPDKMKLAEASETDGEAIEWKVSIHRLIQDGLALEDQRQRPAAVAGDLTKETHLP